MQMASPKQCASPGRLRHNPYASPTTPPIEGLTPPLGGTPMQRSLSTSFASVPPMTPPTNHATLSWPAQHAEAQIQPAMHANCIVPNSEMGVPMMMHQGSFYGDEYAPAPMASMIAVPYIPQTLEPIDPATAAAFMMYNAASAAAAQAAAAAQYTYMPADAAHMQYASQPQQQMPHQQQQQQQFFRGGRGRQQPADIEVPQSGAVPTFEELEAFQGTLTEQARTASGSSFIQAALKESADPRCLAFVWRELSPVLGDLLLDAHGCYVVKTLLDRLAPADIGYVLGNITADEQLGFSICTHSLHTRRVVQHIIENIDGGFLCDLMSQHCAEIAMTQQGCIVMQRSMDHAPPGPARDNLFNAIGINLVRFAKDPFANYVVQHLMEVGERTTTANAMWKSFQGHIVELACNKFASNVIEKCLFHCTAEVQHDILAEMYSIGHQGLYNMLQDSFGNYIIQSSIALATFRDVSLIDERLRPVLAHVPYGHKIEARLDRRLKGKPVTARGPTAGPAAAAAAPARRAGGQANGPRRHDNANGGRLPDGEVPW